MPHAPHIHRWYCTASWQRRRAHQLRVEPLCRLCLEAGRVTPATVADHVTPHRGDFNAFRLGQLRSLCADCHNRLDANNARASQCVRMVPRPTRAIRGTLPAHRGRPSAALDLLKAKLLGPPRQKFTEFCLCGADNFVLQHLYQPVD